RRSNDSGPAAGVPARRRRSDTLRYKLHEPAHLVRIEDELCPGSGVDLGQRSRPAKRECRLVAVNRRTVVHQAVPPDLKRSHLGYAVLDVVERILEYVELAVPASHALRIQATPVHV